MPLPNDTCLCCGAPLANESGPCVRCGVERGREPRCPHCGGVTRVEPHAELRWRCAACGGPRIPSSTVADDGASPELAFLVKTHRAHGAAYWWNGATLALTGIVAIGVVLSLLLFPLSHIASFIIASGALASLFALFQARSRRDRSRAEMNDSLASAWQAAAKRILGSRRGAWRATDLAKALGVEPAVAEGLLTQLSTTDEVHTRIGDDAEILYATSLAGADELEDEQPGPRVKAEG